MDWKTCACLIYIYFDENKQNEEVIKVSIWRNAADVDQDIAEVKHAEMKKGVHLQSYKEVEMWRVKKNRGKLVAKGFQDPK